jgi:uncharacterized RDD family membrane protein YckC
MEWYYAEGGQQIGPVSDGQFQELVASGTVTGRTLVWHADLKDWLEYGQISGVPGGTPCSECGRIFATDDMLRFGDLWVCAECKTQFVQKVKEGVLLTGQLAYAGFWIRAGAKIIDYMILGAVQMVSSLLTIFFSSIMNEVVVMILANLFYIALGAGYTSFFLGRYGATIGKMACQLKVIRPDGQQVTYLRGLGRYFAEMVSGMILGIGYIMSAFDDEKRTLHDRICDTRVVRK